MVAYLVVHLLPAQDTLLSTSDPAKTITIMVTGFASQWWVFTRHVLT